jgi:hypothetical protein
MKGWNIFQNRVDDPIVGACEGTAAVHAGLGGVKSMKRMLLNNCHVSHGDGFLKHILTLPCRFPHWQITQGDQVPPWLFLQFALD